MTLVGPRPETPRLARIYPVEFTTVFRYRPGLTGPGQLVFGDMRMPSVEAAEAFYIREVVPPRFDLDIDYVTHPTVGATINILVRTAARAFRSRRERGAS
jgi:lipopolysaccharide/colanic/teichoic acid biosynthesis glycosyltransferase